MSILVSMKDKVCRHEVRQNRHSMLIQRKHGGVIGAMDLMCDYADYATEEIKCITGKYTYSQNT